MIGEENAPGGVVEQRRGDGDPHGLLSMPDRRSDVGPTASKHRLHHLDGDREGVHAHGAPSDAAEMFLAVCCRPA